MNKERPVGGAQFDNSSFRHALPKFLPVKALLHRDFKFRWIALFYQYNTCLLWNCRCFVALPDNGIPGTFQIADNVIYWE